MAFPAGFIWGAAAASYQIEGATSADGRGACVWDMFCRKDGAVYSGHTGEIACDHYRRWREDADADETQRVDRLSAFVENTHASGVYEVIEAVDE